jgi:hypothetical protein
MSGFVRTHSYGDIHTRPYHLNNCSNGNSNSSFSCNGHSGWGNNLSCNSSSGSSYYCGVAESKFEVDEDENVPPNKSILHLSEYNNDNGNDGACMDIEDDEMMMLLQNIRDSLSVSSADNSDISDASDSEETSTRRRINRSLVDPSASGGIGDGYGNESSCEQLKVVINQGNSMANHDIKVEDENGCDESSELAVAIVSRNPYKQPNPYLMIPVDCWAQPILPMSYPGPVLPASFPSVSAESKGEYRRGAAARWRAKRASRGPSSSSSCRQTADTGLSTVNKKRLVAMQKLRVNGRFVSTSQLQRQGDTRQS